MLWLPWALVAVSVNLALGADVPRYHLPPGRMLVYSIHIENLVGERSTAFDGRWEFTVLRDNADGSKRITAIKGLSQTTTAGGQSRTSENITRGYFDMFPDGRLKLSPSLVPAFNPQMVLPRLPASGDEMSAGWKELFERSNVTTSYTMGQPQGELLMFSGEEGGPYHAINQRHDKWTYQFDPARGTISQVDGENGQNFGGEQKGSAQILLEKEEQLDENEAKSLAAEHDAFTKAYEQADELTRQASAFLGDGQELFTKAEEVLTEASERATLDPVKADFAEAIKQQSRAASLHKSLSRRIEPLLHQPAPDFSLTDGQGNAHKLSDQQGKIVVLEFFRRNANQAAYSLPQVQKLATKLKDKPVVFFGLNSDSEEDVKIVVDATGVTYPVLRMDAQLGEYGISTLPATLIIDQKGDIRAILQGFSKSRAQDIAEHIEALLKTPA